MTSESDFEQAWKMMIDDPKMLNTKNSEERLSHLIAVTAASFKTMAAQLDFLAYRVERIAQHVGVDITAPDPRDPVFRQE